MAHRLHERVRGAERGSCRHGTARTRQHDAESRKRTFAQWGNRVIALDLCDGKVVWVSPDSRSNSSLLLLGDYLVTAFGFTSERRLVYVLDAHSGAVVQQLPVIENLCPSKAWAPNYGGGRCDAPGQRVGAATRPRVEDMLCVVDTNTGSATFVLER